MRILNDSTDVKWLSYKSQNNETKKFRRQEKKMNLSVTESRWYNVWFEYGEHEMIFSFFE